MSSNGARLGVALALLLAVGCGNYSNEDLEFMNAVPDRDDLTVKLKASELSPADEAELSKQTHDVTRTFNGFLEPLTWIDLIRSYEPTSRAPNLRIWGPIPAEGAPGWQWRLVVTRSSATSNVFAYQFEFQRTTDGPDAWLQFLWGTFEAASGARRGVGALHAATTALREGGFPLDLDGQRLVTLDVSYSTLAFPISVTMELVTMPNYPFDDTTARFQYEYEALASGQGAVRFSVTADLIQLTPALETLTVTARWLGSGAGRADATIASGDGMGLAHHQCWDDSFRQTYNDKAWAPAEDFGDPSACPAISVPQ